MKNAMKTTTIARIATFAAAALIAGQAGAFTVTGPRDRPTNPSPSGAQPGQWHTTPAGCSYSRAKAPGYPATWHLIINPHHIGQPNAKATCPPML